MAPKHPSPVPRRPEIPTPKSQIPNYLFALADRLTQGLAHWEPARRQRHADFIRSQRTADGGFRGREGDSDLYYTGFAIRSLAILDGLSPEDSASAMGFLERFDPTRLATIDLLSWLYVALVIQATDGTDLLADLPATFPQDTLARLEQLRRADGGYAKSEKGAIGSTYHTFLIALIQELMGQTPPEPDRLHQFLYDQQREDGGFVEIAPMRRAGTNPTAAAAALLARLDAIDEEIREDVAHFLNSVWSTDGGFAANTRIPFPDGLSTFTALLTALDLKLEGVVHPQRLTTFITKELEFPTGGFRGAAWDNQADVEYTFYGLGVLALLAETE